MTPSSQQHAAVRNRRARKTPAVAPITRAVRAALAMSVTMLALSAPATAAGTCGLAQLARDSHVCGAPFAGHDAGLLSPVDLTRVQDGGPAPASVVAAAAAAGWMDDVSRGDVGSFDHGVTTAAAWDAGAVDDVTVVGNHPGAAALLQALLVDNSDDLVVSGHDRQYGIRESDFAQALTVVNSGDIQVTSAGAGDQYSPGNHAFGIRAASVDGVDVTNTGTISAHSGNDPDFGYSYARGILSLSYQGDASTSNAGSIDATADGEDWALAFGIYNIASGLQTSTIDNSGSTTATATTTGDDDYQWAWAAGARATAIYPAYGAVTGHDEVSLHNSGDIDATASVQGNGGNAVAWGAYTMSLNPGGTSTLENDGSISSFAHAGPAQSGYAYAIGALATGRDTTALVVNHGSVDAVARNDAAGGLAFAIGAKAGYLRSGDGDATITNDGDVHADASGVGGRALSIGLSTGDFYSSRYGAIDNSGSVTSTAGIETSGIAYATGISGRSNQGSDVVNSGEVVADATIVDGAGIAMGLYASSTDGGSTTVANLGDISATVVVSGSDAYNLGHASGIRAGGYDSASVENAGHVDAGVIAATGDVTAYGVVSASYHVTYLDNAVDGVIDATAATDDGDALAVGALASGWDATTLTNYGQISAYAGSASNGDAQAYAAVVSGTFGGIGLLINGGDLEAVASAGAGGHAYATGAYVVANVASIFNDGDSSALATAGEGGIAIARGAHAYGEYAAVYNYGTLDATAIADGGSAMARGIDSLGYLGSSVVNAGDIAAVANADGGDATAMGSYSVGQIYGAYTTNTGSITATASGASADALGVLNAALYLGDAITINDGSITAFAEGGVAPYGEEEAVAIGVYNFAVYYNSVVDNGGSIAATAVATADISGSNGFLQAKAIGVQALAAYGYGVTAVINSGDIHAAAATSQGYASAWGAVAQAGPYGYVAIDNDGSITSYAHTDIGVSVATGAYALSIAGTSQLVNHGDIVAVARAERGIVDVTVDYAESIGVHVVSVPYGAGEAIVDNYGHIQASTHILGGIGYATGVEAYGEYMTLDNAAGASIVATVDAELFGGAFATAVDVGGKLGAEVTNDGTITAYGHANAYSEGEHGFYGAAGAAGIYVNASYQGDGIVTNNGDINAIAIAENSISWAQGGAGATGVHVYAKYDANITNAGDINAIAQAQFGNVSAYGTTIHGKYTGEIVNQAGASIFASATVGSLAGDQSAGHAAAFGTQIFGGMDDAATYNAGSIVSRAIVTPDGTGTAINSTAQAWGSSIGYNSGVLRGEVDNVGSIDAFASADFGHAMAYGAFVATRYAAAVTNTGDIHAAASAVGGNAFAVGSYANAVHQTVSYTCDSNGCDYANPIIDVDGGDSLIDNSGDIFATASASGGIGYSYGAVALGGLTAAIDNRGQIVARTEAGDALAVGALVNGFYGDAQLHNSGTIAAVATGDIANATGASVTGYNGVVLDNTGTIMAGAYGADASAIAVSLESNGANLLTNTGTIAAFGDGARIAVSSATGTTGIANSGSIIGAIQVADGSLDNSVGGYWRALGASDFGANGSIVNAGTIVMHDATIGLGGTGLFDNAGTLAIDGGSTAIETGLFRNDGLVSFIDGATDDVLTIAGDFAGDGAINLDVSGLNLSSDQLYIDGSVIEPTTQVLNVNLLDLPTAASVDIPLLYVSGDSLASDFSLGNVQYGADGFLTMSFGLNSSIDPTNAASDIVSLGVSVDGLNGMGSLGAALAPGAQSLVDAQIGTWRQRMGVVPRTRDDIGLAPWMRVFSGSGGMQPGHHGNFGAGGTFAFDQSNHGWELGLDTRPGEHFAVGVLIGKSQGSQRLADGAGSDRFDGRSFGLYGTWLADNGFYLDASLRWTGIDARLGSATGAHDAAATADSFNIEAGFTAWTLSSGINIVPQLQYTRTRISDITPLRGSQADFLADGGVSSRARVGVAFDRSFEGHGFTWTPYGSINAVHEFDGAYDYAINDALLGTTTTDGTSAMVELGLGARKGGLSFTGGVNWTDGGAQQGVVGGQLVLRYGW